MGRSCYRPRQWISVDLGGFRASDSIFYREAQNTEQTINTFDSITLALLYVSQSSRNKKSNTEYPKRKVVYNYRTTIAIKGVRGKGEIAYWVKNGKKGYKKEEVREKENKKNRRRKEVSV